MARRASVSNVSIGPEEDPYKLSEDAKEKLQQEVYNKLNLTPTKAKVMIGILLITFAMSGTIYSLQAPFFPAEARAKNLTGTENGFVFGVFALSASAFSIPSGKIAFYIGPKLFIILGTLLAGLTTIAFGVVSHIQAKSAFFATATILRILKGLGEIAISVGVMAVATTTLPKYSGSVVSWTETMFGLGSIIGPGIGGPLYDAGGFLLPFAIVGGISVLLVPFLAYIVPADTRLKSISKSREFKGWSILLIPRIWFGVFGSMLGGIALGYLEASLEGHLEMFHLSGSYIGLIFLLWGLGYAGSTPVWGWLCDKGISATLCIVVGNLLIIIGLLFIGPAPFLPFDRSLTLILIGLVINSLGLGGSIPPSFVAMKKVSIEKGYPESIEINGMLSAIFMGALFFGTFVGPLLGGFLDDQVGFAMGSMVFCALHGAMVAVGIFIYVRDRSKSKERKPLKVPDEQITEEGIENPANSIELQE